MTKSEESQTYSELLCIVVVKLTQQFRIQDFINNNKNAEMKIQGNAWCQVEHICD